MSSFDDRWIFVIFREMNSFGFKLVRPGPMGRTRIQNGSKMPIFDYFWGQNQPIFHSISNYNGAYYYLASKLVLIERNESKRKCLKILQ